ncbi:MAG: 2-dehydropantoate 2-reductase [Candidatus Baltobacteraceae bacterium]
METRPERLRIGIIGAGAMGTLFGYHLSKSCEVSVLDSNRDRLAAIETDGLSVNDADPRKVKVARSAADLFGSEMLFLFVKAVDTLPALRPFTGQLNPAAPIVSLQNGIGNEDSIKTALGGSVPIVLGITTKSSFTTASGRARSSEQGITIIGSGGAASSTSRRVAALLSESGLQTSVVYDIRPHLWGKLIANAAINAISALLDCDTGSIPSDANASRLSKALATEAATVAKALKINLPFEDAWKYVTDVIAAGADAKSSMAFDLESKHPSEIDHINGAIVAAGRRIGVPTPYNDAIVRLIKASETLKKKC